MLKSFCVRSLKVDLAQGYMKTRCGVLLILFVIIINTSLCAVCRVCNFYEFSVGRGQGQGELSRPK